jgi:prevent-host-death family protein
MREIEIERAQAKLSALMKAASAGKPTILTRDGEKLAVLLSYDDYQNLPGLWPLADTLKPLDAADI